jgi:hypothetical protein
MTKITNYQLNIEIKEQAKTVFNFFCDLQNHIHLHPLLTEVKIVQTFQNEKGQEVTVYEIHERVKMFGFLSVPNTYIVHRILLKEDNTCIFEAKSFPRIHLSSSYAFLEQGEDGTKVEAQVRIETPFGLSGFVTKTAKKAHTTLLEQLKTHMEHQRNEEQQ